MINRAEIFALMEQGATLITPNNRLASNLLQDFFTSKNRTVLAKPSCMPYQQFLQQLYKQVCYQNPHLSMPVLLNQQQVRYLWAEIINQDIIVNEGMINEIQEAWSRCQRWQQDITDSTFLYTPQTRQFQQWAFQFQQRLQDLNALTDDQLVEFIINHPITISSAHIVWYCFDDLTPQQLHLQHYLQQKNATVSNLDLKKQQSEQAFFAATDEQEEYLQLVNWLTFQLNADKQRIGVVIPDLQNRMHQVQRLLQQHLSESTFNISLGQSLTDYPLVAHGLSWLGFNNENISNQQARLLLHSPYIGHANTEMQARAEALQACDALREYTIDTQLLLAQLKSYTPALVKLLTELPNYPSEATPAAWSRLFKARLIYLGFPGDYSLSSAAYQCYQRFLNLFDELQQLETICNHLTAQEALDVIKNLAKTTIFQAEKTAARIQIAGLLEASGCAFDCLWITGMTDECLPQKTNLSAFIPIALQRQKQMPHATHSHELMLADKTIARFKNSSPLCVFSFPRYTQDKPNLPTPLLTEIASYLPINELLSIKKSQLIPFHDDYQLALRPNERVSGGSALLANQAKCPFRAFAAHRLHARNNSINYSDGPDPLERGQIIHKVMELLWQNLQNQQTLLNLNNSELEQKISAAIHTALQPLQQLRQHSFSPLIQEVELSRLTRLVHACLDWDKKRPSFTIAALEQEFNLQLAGISFKLRVDRIDITDDNKKWVIDYKSSLPTGTPWAEDRPREPQLLLYALLDEMINTIIFTSLKNGQLSCKGFSEDTAEIAGIKAIKTDESWENHRENWRQQLHDLAEEYSQGHCIPQPLNASICPTCDYQNLCRFNMSSVEQTD